MNEDESSYLNAVEEVLSGEVRQADVYGHYSVKEAAYIGVAMMLVTRYKLNNDNVVQERGITEALKNLLVKCLLGTGNRSLDDFATLELKAEGVRDAARKLELYTSTRGHVVVTLRPSPGLLEVTKRYSLRSRAIQVFMRDVRTSVERFEKAQLHMRATWRYVE